MYTGNVTRVVDDLLVSGAVGDYLLQWQRTMTTRYRSTVAASLGDGGSWRHNYQWSFVTGTKNNIISFLINYPDGSEIEFRKNTAADAFWCSYDASTGLTPPPLAGIPDRVGPGSDASHFVLYLRDGGQLFFSKTSGGVWRADKLRDPHGLDTLLAYGTNPTELITVTEPAGRTLQITWFTWTQTKPNGQPFSERLISRVDTSDAQSAVYNYTTYTSPAPEQFVFSTLTKADYGDGTAANYAYRSSNRSDGHGRPLPLSCDDPRYQGAMSRVQYDYTMDDGVYGLIHSEKSLLTGTTLATFTMPGTNQRTEQTGDGRTRTLTYDRFRLASAPDFSGKVTTYAYAASNYVASRTDALNHTTICEREPQIGAITKITYADNSYIRCVYSDTTYPYFVAEEYDELNHKISYTRDTRNNITRIDFPDGTYTAWTYNAFNEPLTCRKRNGGIENHAYDARGLKTSSTDTLNKVTSYTYDAHDRLANITDPLNHVVKYEYNLRGQVTKVINPDNTFTAFSFDGYGNRISMTDELNHAWTRTYDEYNRLISETDPLNRTTSYSYGLLGGAGCGSCHTDANLTRVTLPSGKYTTYSYDANYRRTGMTVGANTTAAATTAYAYDDVGNVITVTDPRNKVTSNSYDSRNRLINQTDPLNHVISWTYNLAGNILSSKRADNGVCSYEYDSMRRRTKTTDPLNQVTLMTYNASGNLASLTDSKNNIYSFLYDTQDRKISAIYPSVGGSDHEDWTYNDVGNVKTYTTRAGQVRTMTYDIRNRVTLADWNDATPDVTSTYDAASRLLTLNNANSALTYTYDAANQLLSETQSIVGWAGGAKTVSYAYDLDGNRATLTYPNALALTYAYTARNQLESITADNPPPLAAYAYDLAGNRTAKTWENGTSAAYTYDDANRLTSLAHQNGGGVFASFAYAYNAVNNRTSVTREDGLGDVYGYDAIDQLTGVQYNAQNPATAPANPQKTQSFVYDATGNRTSASENGVSAAYAANALNQYTQASAGSLSYDANGNLQTGLFGNEFQPWIYDAQNRLTSAYTRPGPAPNYIQQVYQTAYDARNRPVKRGPGGRTQTYLVYDGWNLVAEYALSTSTNYIHGAQTDEILAKIDSAGAVLYYHHDGLGSTAALTDATGANVERYRYDAFGQPTVYNSSFPNGGSGKNTAYNNRFLFTGREWIASWEAYDYRNRAYSSGLGRFLQNDPIRFRGNDANLLRYGFNDPTSLKDADGLQFGSNFGPINPPADWQPKREHPMTGIPWDPSAVEYYKQGLDKERRVYTIVCCTSGAIVGTIGLAFGDEVVLPVVPGIVFRYPFVLDKLHQLCVVGATMGPFGLGGVASAIWTGLTQSHYPDNPPVRDPYAPEPENPPNPPRALPPGDGGVQPQPHPAP